MRSCREELERRELLAAPISVGAPNGGALVTASEIGSYTFSGSSSFVASDGSNFGQNYEADLTVANGIITFDAVYAGSLGLSVSNYGTASVAIVGRLVDIDTLLDDGITFLPDAGYSGDAGVSLTVKDLSNLARTPGAGSVPLHVTPSASDAVFNVRSVGLISAPSSGFAFPPGFVSVDLWTDADNSETVTLSFTLLANGAGPFTLSAGGATIASTGPNTWQLSATNPTALQGLLDSLILTPSDGFSGPTDLIISATIRDDVTFADTTTATNGHFLDFGEVPIRFFEGPSVLAGPAFGVEGGSIDLGGHYAVSDSDELDGDVHTLTLAVPSGTLTYNAGAVPVTLTVNRDVGPGGTAIVFTGTIDDINAFLAQAGSLTYTPDSPYFSGIVPIAITLTNHPYDPSTESPPFGRPGGPTVLPDPAPGEFFTVSALAFVPVADHSIPSALDVTTNQDTPVALFLGASALADPDGSESVLIVLDGVPAGATLNHGSDLGSGQWGLSPSDLTGLLFTPPPGASGVFALGVRVVVTDNGVGLGIADTATESTAFTVTVIAAPAASTTTTQNLPPDDDVETAVTFSGTDGTGESGTSADTDVRDDIGENHPDQHSTPAVVAAYSGGARADSGSANEARENAALMAPGSLFSQVEVPLPTYASGERHPLPPVLPLDQTLPIAGFSDSGGDSFALIDKLYRDAAAERLSPAQLGAAPPAEAPADGAAVVALNTDRAAPNLAVALAVDGTDDATGAKGPPAAADAPAGDGPMAASFALGAVFLAFGWRVRGSLLGAAVSAGRWMIRTFHRRPTERTV